MRRSRYQLARLKELTIARVLTFCLDDNPLDSVIVDIFCCLDELIHNWVNVMTILERSSWKVSKSIYKEPYSSVNIFRNSIKSFKNLAVPWCMIPKVGIFRKVLNHLISLVGAIIKKTHYPKCIIIALSSSNIILVEIHHTT